jgi:hypothetical protein
MAQLSDIRTEILETAGLAADDARFPDTTMNRIVNRALRQITSEAEWPWNQTSETINTAADTQEYTPASGWSKTIRLQYENRDLHEYPSQDAAQYQNASGVPVGFYIEEDQIHLVPTPDGVYAVTHIYQSVESALSGDSDEPNLEDRYLDWLVQTALVQVAQRLRDVDLYSLADRERRQWRQRAIDDRRRSSQTAIPQARNDWWI